MDVNTKVLCFICNTNRRQHQSSMHYWQYKWTSTSKFYALLAIQMDVNIKVIRTYWQYKWTSTSKFYALLAIPMDVKIKALRTIDSTNGRQHQSSVQCWQY